MKQQRFIVNLFNHNEKGKRSLEDVVAILAHQLRALGHVCEWNDRQLIQGFDGLNLIIEGFVPGGIECLRRAHARGGRFIIVATEQPTPKGFNWGFDPEMVERQKNFPEAAQYAEAILCLVPGSEEWYGQHAPAARIELGFAPTLVRPASGEPDHVFGFYGSLTKRRRTILRRLERKVAYERALRLIYNFASREERDREMQRARLLVQIRVTEKAQLVSSSRLATALCLGRPVVAEPHHLSQEWEKVVHFSGSTDEFVEDAVNMRSFWKSLHAKQFDRFREIMSPQRCLGNALDRLEITRRAPGKPIPGYRLTPVLAGASI
jgi:hypothetical protein